MPDWKRGIAFEISTTDFNEAVYLCEKAFDDCRTVEWKEVKNSKDFKRLSEFLKANDVNSRIFILENSIKE